MTFEKKMFHTKVIEFQQMQTVILI